MRIFSDKHRPVHLGPYPLERLARTDKTPDLTTVPPMLEPDFHRPGIPESIVNAMGEYQAMLDAIRVGLTNKSPSTCPDSLNIRANHLKAFGYFADASMVGVACLPTLAKLPQPRCNPDIDALAETLRTSQTTTLAAGIDMIMADLKDTMEAPPSNIDAHTHALVFLYDWPRDPVAEEPGCDWIIDAQIARASLRASETAVVIANYLRLLGYDSRAHSLTATDVDLNRLCVAAGLATVEQGMLANPYVGARFTVAAVTTNFSISPDRYLLPESEQPRWQTHGPAWWFGKGFTKSAINPDPYTSRRFVDGPHPFESLRRVEKPTTYIDDAHVARVPKRTDMFARAQFGDMGNSVQTNATAGYYARKAATSMAQRRALGAFVPIQDGAVNTSRSDSTRNASNNANNLKAAAYFLGADAVGLSPCPEWTWYSHDAIGDVIDPPHKNAISMIIDQGFETMEGASGDDWISVAQSMRAYLRFALLGGVLAKHIRNLGYSAKSHTLLDGTVLQPPLLLLSGLGEVSRIGEVILNPFLGPRLKSGVVTTNMPMTYDRPIDFGLQDFCEKCNKCARECPSGAITAGPKLMFNGYEIWKSDSQKCATYRITTEGGAMCGRCMKTCPWNLEGLLAERPFRYAAMNFPVLAPWLAKLDDAVGNGDLNPVKKWWWDLEMNSAGGYEPTKKQVNERTLQRDLHLNYDDQTLAVFPANLAPHPWPFPYPMDREKGIEAYQALITVDAYRTQIRHLETHKPTHKYTVDTETPVIKVTVKCALSMSDDITSYELVAADGADLPPWLPGAHIDVVVAPEYLRAYSLTGDCSDRSRYRIGVLREEKGRGGSALMHRIFSPGRRVFISHPINHFPLNELPEKTYLLGGGIGITPMIAMAHRLHSVGRYFELHYSIRSRKQAGFLDELASLPWYSQVTVHVSDENSRADLARIFNSAAEKSQMYTCGPDVYMNAVVDAAVAGGIAEEACHSEYFSVPELPVWENDFFSLKLARTGIELPVPANKTAAAVLNEAGYHIDVKCSDGLCGVCQCGLVAGEVEHRDFVLSKKQRKTKIILCQSRATHPNGVVTVDM